MLHVQILVVDQVNAPAMKQQIQIFYNESFKIITLLGYHFQLNTKNINVYLLMILNQRSYLMLFVLMYHFLMNEDNEEFHYLSSDDLYQIASILNQNQSMTTTMMMLDGYKPIYTQS